MTAPQFDLHSKQLFLKALCSFARQEVRQEAKALKRMALESRKEMISGGHKFLGAIHWRTWSFVLRGSSLTPTGPSLY